MNSLQINKVIYEIQDLVIRKGLTSFKKFKIHFQNEVKFNKELKNHKFINNLFKNIFTFLKELQKHSSSIVLIQAMKPVFEMLLFEMVIPKYVTVFHVKWNEEYHNVEVSDLHMYGVCIKQNRKLVQTEYNYFVLPYKKEIHPFLTELERKEKKWYEFLKNERIKIMGFKAYNIEIDRVYSEMIDYLKAGEEDIEYLSRKELENFENEYEEFERKFDANNYNRKEENFQRWKAEKIEEYGD